MEVHLLQGAHLVFWTSTLESAEGASDRVLMSQLMGFLAIQRAYWINNLDPWVIHFSGNFGIRWYGLSYGLGFLLTWLIFTRWARQGRLPITAGETNDLIADAAVGMIVGGRLGYCLLYNFDEVIHNPLEIFAVWHGGMASHGGILGLIIAIWLFAWRRGLDPWVFLDAAVVTGPIGIAFGRLANFINGELWGRPTKVPWAVIFPKAPLIDGINVPRHPSQLYAAGIEGVLLFLIALWVYHRQSSRGFTTAVVCIFYGVGRFIDEFWREPDPGQPLLWGWVSKGQLLTLPMIVLGIAFAWWRYRTVNINDETL
jgi:phosphatidylglycerol:prolipoprotein diacylglycerol transferase